MSIDFQCYSAQWHRVSPQPGTRQRFGSALGRADSADLGEHVAACAVLVALQVAVAHQRYCVALHGIDPVQYVMLRCHLCQNDIAYLQIIRTHKRHAVHSALDIRTHAHARRGEHHLLAFGYQPGDLRNKYLVRQLHISAVSLLSGAAGLSSLSAAGLSSVSVSGLSSVSAAVSLLSALAVSLLSAQRSLLRCFATQLCGSFVGQAAQFEHRHAQNNGTDRTVQSVHRLVQHFQTGA